MRLTITQRTFAALLVTSLVTIALNTVVGQWSFQRKFLAYKAEQESDLLTAVTSGFAKYYSDKGSWSDLASDPLKWRALLRQHSPASSALARPRPPPPGSPDHRNQQIGEPLPGPGLPLTRPHPDPLQVATRMALFDANGELIIGEPSDPASSQSRIIIVDGIQVGSLRLALPKNLTDQVDVRFEVGQSRSLLISAAVISLLAAIAAFFLARQMTQPVRLIAERARAMTNGNFTDRLFLEGNSELKDLAEDINQLGATLAQDQKLRREWLSDISHELRTPLAILIGELQAVEDGIRTFDSTTLSSLQSEAARLNLLVQDLSVLAASDEAQLVMDFSTVDINELMEQCIVATRTRLDGLSLDLDFLPSKIPLQVKVDVLRIQQVFTNLLENSIKYTDGPGQIKISVNLLEPTMVGISIEDSTPGVPKEVLNRLFDRLFRVEQSRDRKSGGAGLGLSICKALIDAHQGTMRATPSSLGGLRIDITLPLVEPVTAKY